MSKPKTEAVRKSEELFKERGGKMIMTRYEPIDLSAIYQISALTKQPNVSQVIRDALHHYHDTVVVPKEQIKKESESMNIIAVANGKGGSGKSTLAQTLADGLSILGYKVVLLDADRQQSSLNLKKRRDENFPDLSLFSVYSISSKFTEKTLRSDFGQADFIVIDCPGGRDDSLDNMTLCAISSADLVLMPLNASIHDADQSVSTIKAIKDRQIIADGLPIARAIISRAAPKQRAYRGILDFLASHEILKLKTDLTNRTQHVELPTHGLTGIYSRVKSVREECEALVNEVLTYFNK